MASERTRMDIIIDALSKIDSDINNGIWEMAQGLTNNEITNLFNQTALDFFNLAIDITRKRNIEREYGFSAYMNLFEAALKMNVTVPVDRFTMLILEFAPDIYGGNEKVFLDMHIPDSKINTGNEFNIIRSDAFKKLWLILNSTEKELVTEKVLSLTTYAHAYFYKLLLNKK